MTKKFFLIVFSGLFFLNVSFAKVNFKGQFSGTVVANQDRYKDQFIGMRYIPELFITTNSNFDFDISLNSYSNYYGTSLSDYQTESKVKMYRLWLRYSQEQYEIRFGLQKINFGPALLLRSLMWFDRTDQRDPLQLTDGVWGLLLRYYFLNNANIWLWTLYGNNKTKGWEIFPTAKTVPEYGARIQLPLIGGELAAIAHFRKAQLGKKFILNQGIKSSNFHETRWALDGKWDVGVGIWFEAATVHQHEGTIPLNYQTMITIGSDYTFPIGNGLHLLGEQFQLKYSNKIFRNGEKLDFSAILFDYPLGLIDQIFGFVYYDWKNKDFYRLFRWQRTYDNWSWHLMVFWNPERNQLPGEMNSQMVFSGKGLMLIAVLNH